MSRIFLHNRVLGVVFIGLMIFAVWMINALFTQKFTDFDRVKLNTDTIGLQLPERADVKVRGVIVGQVLDARSEVDGAVLTLGLDPDKIDAIPADVTASLLPKTLFGEKYVELEIPEGSVTGSKPLADGDRITQTKLPIEVEKVLNDIYPLLRSIQPAELNYTLNALATALEGRGDQIGENLETLNAYLKRFNPLIPKFVDDLKLLGQVSDVYADVLPQVANTLRNTVKTGNTLESKEAQLNRFLTEVRGFSDTAKSFLDANGNNIVRLGNLSAPQLDLLERYSVTFPCLLGGIVGQLPQLASTFRGNIFHINLITLTRQPRGYNAGDRPVVGVDNPPDCAELPNPPVPFPASRVPNFDDGVDNLGRGDGQRTATGFDSSAGRFTAGSAGSLADKAFFNALTAPVLGVPVDQVPDLATLLFGPMAAGTEVNVE